MKFLKHLKISYRIFSLFVLFSSIQGFSGVPPYPTKPVVEIYKLEVHDSKHRIGYTLDATKPSLQRKMEEFLKLNLPSHQFWEWLDQMAHGSEIPEVIYLDSKEREKYKITFHPTNRITSPILESLQSNPSSIFLPSPPSRLIFVMDQGGDFYAHPKIRGSSTVRAFHHTSFFAGAPVSAAGELVIDPNTSRLVKVTSDSGHYQFEEGDLEPLLDGLMTKKLDTNTIEFATYDMDIQRKRLNLPENQFVSVTEADRLFRSNAANF